MSKDLAILREAITKVVPMLAGKGLKVTQRGTTAFAETNSMGVPTRINIPYLPDEASAELIQAVQGFIDHEVAHVLFTDWVSIKAGYDLGPKYASMHNIVEDTLIERKMMAKFKGSAYNISTMHGTFLKEWIEPHVDAILKDPIASQQAIASKLFVPMFRAWAGQDTFIDYMDDKWHLIDEVVAKLSDIPARVPKVKDSWEALEIAKDAIERLIKKPKTPKKKEEREEEFEKLREEAEKPDEEMPEEDAESETPDADDAEDGPDAEDAEGDKEGAGKDTGPDDAPDAEDEEDDEEVEDSGPKSSEKSGGGGKSSVGGGSSSDLDETIEGEESFSDGDDDIADAGDDAFEDEEGEDPAGGHGKGEPLSVEMDDEGFEESGEEEERDEAWEDALDKFSDEDKEFDDWMTDKLTEEVSEITKTSSYTIFSKDSDRIEVLKVKRASGEAVKRLDDAVGEMVGPMQRKLERLLAARSKVVRVPGFKSGRLHGASLHRAATGDGRLFRRTQEHKSMAVALSLVVDCSGSMGGSRIEAAAQAAYALGQTLERVGVPWESLGFTTVSHGDSEYASDLRKERSRMGLSYSRTESLYMPIFKEFGSTMNTKAKERFAAIPNIYLSNNVDGECIEIAVQRVRKRSEPRKIVFVLSDGSPCAAGDMREQSTHLKRVVAETERSGVEIIGIGIQTDSVSHYYDKWIKLNEVSDLPEEVMSKLSEYLLK